MSVRVFMMKLVVVFSCCFAATSAQAGEALEAALDATCRIVYGDTSATCFFIAREESPDATSSAAATNSDSPEQEAQEQEAAEKSDSRKVVLVTAAHFFEGKQGEECKLVLRTRNADQSFARREVTVKFRDGENTLWKKHPDLDVAVLEVTLPDDVAITPLKPRQLCDESRLADRTVRVGQEVFIPGYPAKLECNAAGCAVVRRGTIATYPLSPSASAREILIHSNTFGGDSGAPVVVTSAPEPLVVGLVIGMQRQTDKSSMSFQEVITHTPLGLAIVIQAPFIQETIDLLGK